MSRVDLQERFISALMGKESKRADLVNRISEILRIEREAVSRRLNGKVSFTIPEMGQLAEHYGISLDFLLHDHTEYQWLPFLLRSPMNFRSIDALSQLMEFNIERIRQIALEPCESGNVYSNLPIELYLHYPVLRKFMFFKWGHYFVGTKEFDRFSDWECPSKLEFLSSEIPAIATNLDETFMIWDNNLIWQLVGEIESFHRMHAITTAEKDEIKEELKELLFSLEAFLRGIDRPDMSLSPSINFYVSTMNMGFTSNYHTSENMYLVVFQTNFSYAVIEDCQDSFIRMRDWLKSLRNVSTLLSESGRIERQLFFERQHKIIDCILK